MKKTAAKLLKSEKEITAEVEKKLLKQFKEILNNNQEVAIDSLALDLGMSGKLAMTKLVQWHNSIPFEIDGNMLVVEDLSQFIDALDGQFDDWQDKEITKSGKVE